MASFEFLAIILTGLGLPASILYYTITLRNANKTRQAQLFNSVYQTLNDKEFFELPWILEVDMQYTDYDDFMQKYGLETNRDAYMKFHRMLSYYEGIGVYVKNGLISAEIIDDFMSGDIVAIWEKYEPFLLEFRRRRNSPYAYEHFEYLYDRVKSIQDMQHPELVGKKRNLTG